MQDADGGKVCLRGLEYCRRIADVPLLLRLQRAGGETRGRRCQAARSNERETCWLASENSFGTQFFTIGRVYTIVLRGPYQTQYYIIRAAELV